ncbi:MAG TPA: penicillin acylase family protein [Candidatus Stackebrandtia excrementipullorum]|nr:penicillin acylase family protein [Candidatus Stackebrandtia excrementipullorum]
MSIAPSVTRPRLRAVGRWSLVVVFVIVIVASVTVGVVSRQAHPQVDGEIELPGLSAPVEVVRDEWGVPQVYADTAHDLFAAQGYLHAQDRFFEMDFRRHVTAGRLSELFGPDQVATDTSIRTMGWRRVAEAEWDRLDPATRGYFNAYAEGVNAYLAGKSPGDIALEYTLLGFTGLDYQVREWSPIDGLTWLKAMAWDLKGNYSAELDRARLAGAGFSAEQISQLWPEYPADEHLPIVPEGTVVDGEFTTDAQPTSSWATVDVDLTDVLQRTSAATESVSAVLGPERAEGVGSNSWVVSGEMTDTGAPLLANDPHLGAAMPSVWYQMGLHCRDVGDDCPFAVTGFGFSGVPGIMIGHNASMAWGFTNLGPDVTDFYVERIENDSYLVDGEWRPMKVETEVIAVAGAEPVEIRIRSTEHGPIMSDNDAALAQLAEETGTSQEANGDGTGYALALQWTALEPGNTADAIFALNTAQDFADFQAAASQFEVPAQNLIYADRDGTIAYQAPGRIPIRGNGDGTFPAPGWDSSYNWEGYIPFSELPSVVNPDEGFIVTANNAVVDEQYPYLLTKDWAYGYRSQRIRDMITSAEQPITAESTLDMLMDSANEGAVPVLDALQALPSGDLPEAFSLLDDWDLQQDASSAPAALYNATWKHLLSLTFDELPDGSQPGGGERWARVMADLLTTPDSPWWDRADTDEVETRDDILLSSAHAATAELEDAQGTDFTAWRWGAMHTLTVTHQSLGSSGIALMEQIFNSKTVESGGGTGLVNATGWDAAAGYEVTTVPSMRMIVDLNDFDQSQWINLTGNSGHPFHRNHADQLPYWRDGLLLPMVWSRSAVDEAGRNTVTFHP